MTFRNDDVRNTIDRELVDMINVFTKNKIPLTLAVEPSNLTKEVTDWLVEVKKEYTNLIEIMQHGYDHSIKNKIRKGEFGGQRNYEEQFNDIKRGKELMNQHFGALWFEAFNYPYGEYNSAAMTAVNDNGFRWYTLILMLNYRAEYFINLVIC